ncbi:MAG TPA: hypothetical protein VGJ40_00030 [Gaiellaceae bacterium]|jgi:hypothetical protein
MRTGKQHLIRITVVVLAGLAIGIPTAQASGQPPDSRPYYRGTEAALAPKSLSPDDRAYNRAIPVPSTKRIVSPDDRAFSRSIPVEPRALAPTVSVRPHGFNWGDALVGGTFGLVFALLGAGAVAIGLRHRRSVLRTA